MPIWDIGNRATAGLTSDTKPTRPDGWVFMEYDVTNALWRSYVTYRGTWREVQPGGRFAIHKDADELVDTSTTLQNDNDFAFAIAANEVWVGHMALFLTDEGGGDTPGIKLGWSLPVGATFMASGIWHDQAGGFLDFESATSNPFFVHDVSIEANSLITVEFSIANGSNAGTAQFQWAQNTSSSNGTIMKAESYLTAFRE